jgi:hypothetical protein
VYARQDGAVILHSLADAKEQVLLDPGTYDISGDNFLIPILWPARRSPDGQWLLVPTPHRGTWLVSLEGQVQRQVSGRLSFTWAPDSCRIAYQMRGEIYVQDIVAGTEPELLAQLADKELYYPTWSPGGVAAYSCEIGVCTAWLFDVSSGAVRELGRFAPLPMMAVPGMIQWSPDGTAVLVQSRQGTLVFPIQGSGPLPLTSTWQDRRGTLSPDGMLEAWAEPGSDPGAGSRLAVARVGTDRQVTYDLAFEQIEQVFWTSDGRRLLVRDYDGMQRLWAVDPAAGETLLVAERILSLGTPGQLLQRSTEVGAPAVTLHALPDAGGPSDWRTYGVAGWPVCLRVPSTWRAETIRNPHTREVLEVRVANFAFARGEGVAALTDDHLELSFAYHERASGGPGPSLGQMKDAESTYATVESATLDDRQAIRIRPHVSPVSEEMRVQLDGGQLWITYKPLSSTHRAVLDRILAQIDLDPEQPCSTQEPALTATPAPSLPEALVSPADLRQPVGRVPWYRGDGLWLVDPETGDRRDGSLVSARRLPGPAGATLARTGRAGGRPHLDAL